MNTLVGGSSGVLLGALIAGIPGIIVGACIGTYIGALTENK